MKKGILFAVSCLFLACFALQGGGLSLFDPLEAASAPVMKAKPMHPLPDWDGQEDLRHRTTTPQEGSHGRPKFSILAILLASLLLFLMWKLLQGLE